MNLHSSAIGGDSALTLGSNMSSPRGLISFDMLQSFNHKNLIDTKQQPQSAQLIEGEESSANLKGRSNSELSSGGGILSQIKQIGSAFKRKDSEFYFQSGNGGEHLDAIPSMPSITSESIPGIQKSPNSKMRGVSTRFFRGSTSSQFLRQQDHNQSSDKLKHVLTKNQWGIGGSSTVTPIAATTSSVFSERNLQNNLDRMLKFVKLKKQIGEMKRHMLKSTIGKQLIGLSIFRTTLGDVTCDSTDPKRLQEEQSFCGFSPDYYARKVARFLDSFQLIPTIEPSSTLKLTWDLMLGVVLMIYFFFIPVHIAINTPIHMLSSRTLGYIMNLCMGLDILLSMNTAYFEKGVTILDKKKIFLYYVRNYLWSDLLSQIPLLSSELGEQDTQTEKFFVLSFFVKLRNFTRIFRKIEESFHLSPKTTHLLSLLKLILTILFFSHIFSCVWLFVGRAQLPYIYNWLNKCDMDDQDWVQQYIAAYYFSTVTMITVGYGDINPQNNTERIVCVGTMLVSCIIFAYTINQIGIIFQDIFSQDRQMKEFFYVINDYMDNKNIGFSLQYKIREYLDFYWREQDQNQSDLEKKIIDSLSESLREQLMIEANRIVLKDSVVFHANFSQAVVLKMIPIIQTIHTTPNQVIFSEGQFDEDMFIYFIEKGKVEVCREVLLTDQPLQAPQKTHKPVTLLGPGSCFGAYSFLTNLERREMARSVEFTKLLMVRRSDFISLLTESPSDLEKFHHVKDRILFENNQEHMGVRCAACSSNNHEIQHCHFFHFQPDPYIVIRRYNLQHSEQIRDEEHNRFRGPRNTIGEFILNHGKVVLQVQTLSPHATSHHPSFSNQCQKWKSEQQEIIQQYISQYLFQDDISSDDEEKDDEFGDESDDFPSSSQEGQSQSSKHSQTSLNSSSVSSSSSSCNSSNNSKKLNPLQLEDSQQQPHPSQNINLNEYSMIPLLMQGRKLSTERIEEVEDDDNSPQIFRFRKSHEIDASADPSPFSRSRFCPPPVLDNFIATAISVAANSERISSEDSSPQNMLPHQSDDDFKRPRNKQFKKLSVITSKQHRPRRNISSKGSKLIVSIDDDSQSDNSPQLVSLGGKSTTIDDFTAEVMPILRLDNDSEDFGITFLSKPKRTQPVSAPPPSSSQPSVYLKLNSSIKLNPVSSTSLSGTDTNIEQPRQRLNRKQSISSVRVSRKQKTTVVLPSSSSNNSIEARQSRRRASINESPPLLPQSSATRKQPKIKLNQEPHLFDSSLHHQHHHHHQQQQPSRSSNKKRSTIILYPIQNDSSQIRMSTISPPKKISSPRSFSADVYFEPSAPASVGGGQQLTSKKSTGFKGRSSISNLSAQESISGIKAPKHPSSSGDQTSPLSAMSLSKFKRGDHMRIGGIAANSNSSISNNFNNKFVQRKSPLHSSDDNRLSLKNGNSKTSFTSPTHLQLKSPPMPQISAIRARLLSINTMPLTQPIISPSILHRAPIASAVVAQDTPSIYRNSLAPGPTTQPLPQPTPPRKLQRQSSINVALKRRDSKTISQDLAVSQNIQTPAFPLTRQHSITLGHFSQQIPCPDSTELKYIKSYSVQSEEIEDDSFLEDQSLFTIIDFDSMKDFQFYFPRFNSTCVLSKTSATLNIQIMKFLKRIKKQRQLNQSSRLLASTRFPSVRRSILVKKQNPQDAATSKETSSSQIATSAFYELAQRHMSKKNTKNSSSNAAHSPNNQLTLHTSDQQSPDEQTPKGDNKIFSQANINTPLQSPKIMGKSIFNNRVQSLQSEDS